MRNCVLALFLAAGCAVAQVTDGSLAGYVFDPAQKRIGGAAIFVSNAANGLIRRVLADSAGFYSVAGLPPAVYSVTATAPQFERLTVDNVTVPVNEHVRLDLTLAVADQRTSVTIQGGADLLPADISEVATVIDRRQIAGLPLNRRDFLQLALLAAGVAPPVQDSELSTRGRFSMHAHGGREEFNGYLLDGADNNDGYENTYTLQPPVDFIQEFKIATATFSAEYGRNAGGQVNVITRSGDNRWQGALYSYLRNRALDARNFFDGARKPGLDRNESGAGIGGPLAKDRTFVFANFDFLRERNGLTRLATVPALDQRAAATSGRVSPLGVRILDLFPLPNLPGNSGNYLAQRVQRETTPQWNVRIDHRLTSRDQLTARYSYGNQDLFEPYVHGSSDIPGFGDFVANIGHNAVLHDQRVISARSLSSLRLAFNRSFRHVLPENNRTDVGRLWGVNWLNLPPRDFGFPLINVSGFSPVGDQTQLPIARHTDTYQLAESFSIARGPHALKAGGEVRHIRFAGTLDYFARGSLTFSGAITGSGIGDLLAGLPSFGIQASFDNPQNLRTTAYNAWVQDGWKPLPNLTINLGMRYEYNTPPTDPHDRLSIFDPRTGAITNVGKQGIPRAGIRPDRHNFAPRGGFARMPARDLVVRGGYGIYYEAGMLVVNSSLYFNPPYFNVHAYFPTAVGLLTLVNPFPANGGVIPPPSPNTLSPDLTTGYLQDWSFGAERQLGVATRAGVSYVGSKGTHLIRSRDLNQPLPAPGSLAARRPLPAFAGIFLIESGANSSYQSFESSLERRFARHFSLRAAFTYAKSIDDTSAFLGTAPDKNFPQNSRDLRAERGLSSFDVRRRLTTAGVLALPSRNVLSRNVELRSILAVQSGQPFTPYLRFDNSNTGNSGGIFGLDRPDLLRNPALARPGPERWFDTTAFHVPAPYTFGSAGRNILTGPGLFSVDLALSRRFQVGERTSISLDTEVFNILNHTQFNLPERYADQPSTFGKIFSAKPPRLVQFALRFSF